MKLLPQQFFPLADDFPFCRFQVPESRKKTAKRHRALNKKGKKCWHHPFSQEISVGDARWGPPFVLVYKPHELVDIPKKVLLLDPTPEKWSQKHQLHQPAQPNPWAKNPETCVNLAASQIPWNKSRKIQKMRINLAVSIFINGYGSKPWHLVNPKVAGKWVFIPLKLIVIGFDPIPNLHKST